MLETYVLYRFTLEGSASSGGKEFKSVLAVMPSPRWSNPDGKLESPRMDPRCLIVDSHVKEGRGAVREQ